MTGGAFHAGVLAGLHEATGWDPRSADVILGTSAGSIAAASLRAGLSAEDMAAQLEGRPLSSDGEAIFRSAGISWRRLPRPMPRRGSRRLGPAAPEVLIAAALRPWSVRPASVIAGLLPAGSVSTSVISDGIGALLHHRWPDQPLWVSAVRISDGRLIVFGRNGNCPNPGDAVAASCAIPGWFTPVEIDGQRYVDGGAHSITNAGHLGRAENLDAVVVSAPMGRTGERVPGTPWRHLTRLQLSFEVQALRRKGIPVLAIQPTPADQAVMGRDPMNGSRRDQIVRQARKSTLARMTRPDVQAVVEMLRASAYR